MVDSKALTSADMALSCGGAVQVDSILATTLHSATVRHPLWISGPCPLLPHTTGLTCSFLFITSYTFIKYSFTASNTCSFETPEMPNNMYMPFFSSSFHSSNISPPISVLTASIRTSRSLSYPTHSTIT